MSSLSQRLSPIAFALAFLPCTPASSSADNDRDPIVRNIAIEGNTRTRAQVIRRELLFGTGERLDRKRLAETERNLRRLLFLGKVSIEVSVMGDSADVAVTVEDLYARALSPLFSGELDEFSYGLIGLDYNFLGRGQTARLAVERRAISGNFASLLYHIPRLADSPHNLTTSGGVGSEGHEAQIVFTRPFRSLADPWSYGLSLSAQESVRRLYSVQVLTERYTDELNGFSAWATHSHGDSVKFRPSVRLDITDQRFAATRSVPVEGDSLEEAQANFSYAPTDRRRILPSAALTIWKPQYEKTQYYQALGRIEDVQIGGWLALRAGLSHKKLGSDRSFAFYWIQLSPRIKRRSHTYGFITLFASVRQRREGLYNLYGLVQFRGHKRLHAKHSLALRLRWEAVHRFEDSTQLLLGLDSGLRGYAPRRFDGTRRALLNLEARPTFYRRPSYILVGALFVDGGAAWTPSHTSANLQMSAGLGGRLGLPRVYNTPIMRADLAYALGDSIWQLSLGIGHYF